MGPDYGRNTSRCTTRRGVFGHESDGQGTEKHPVRSDRITKTVLKLSEWRRKFFVNILLKMSARFHNFD